MWRTRRGAAAIGVAVLLASAVGCSAAPAVSPVPTSTAADEPDVLPSAPSAAPDPEAEQRAQTWADTLSVPPAAERVDHSPAPAFGSSWQGWICSPMATRTVYWTVKGMSLAETANWMLAHPSPGLLTSMRSPLSPDDESVDGTSFGQTPEENSPDEGVAVTIVRTDEGAAIRAEVGARPAGATCATPEPGTMFGGIGQG